MLNMDIKKMTKSGTAQLGELRITFSIDYPDGENPKSFLGYIYKDLSLVGSFNRDSNGIIGYSLHEGHSLGITEVQNVFTHILTESETVFNPELKQDGINE